MNFKKVGNFVSLIAIFSVAIYLVCPLIFGFSFVEYINNTLSWASLVLAILFGIYAICIYAEPTIFKKENQQKQHKTYAIVVALCAVALCGVVAITI